jgi:hypothetical protein
VWYVRRGARHPLRRLGRRAVVAAPSRCLAALAVLADVFDAAPAPVAGGGGMTPFAPRAQAVATALVLREAEGRLCDPASDASLLSRPWRPNLVGVRQVGISQAADGSCVKILLAADWAMGSGRVPSSRRGVPPVAWSFKRRQDRFVCRRRVQLLVDDEALPRARRAARPRRSPEPPAEHPHVPVDHQREALAALSGVTPGGAA